MHREAEPAAAATTTCPAKDQVFAKVEVGTLRTATKGDYCTVDIGSNILAALGDPPVLIACLA